MWGYKQSVLAQYMLLCPTVAKETIKRQNEDREANDCDISGQMVLPESNHVTPSCSEMRVYEKPRTSLRDSVANAALVVDFCI